MARHLKIAAAQLGPLHKADSRAVAVKRLTNLLREAHGMGAKFVVFPELAFTTFFPRWWMENQAEVDERFFEKQIPSRETQPLFDEAKKLGIGFYIGYAELTPEGRRFNTAILVGPDGSIVGKYRKIHLPGTADAVEGRQGQHLEKHYFEVGDLGFGVFRAFGGIMGMCICNDRRWPETYRVMGLQGVEMIMLGYNSPVGLGDSFDLDSLELFHNRLVMQSGAYQNGTWVIGAAKCGFEEGYHMIGQSAIIAPSGEIVAMCHTYGDELCVRRCDLDFGLRYKNDIFNFAAHRRPEHYRLIVERTGAKPPPE